MKFWRSLFMSNKLKKSRSGENDAVVSKSNVLIQSRTMAFAQAAVAQYPSAARPKTVTEQYWAARALTAEALLSVKASHQEELRQLAQSETQRRTADARQQDISFVHQVHEHRQARLEKFTIFLVALIVALVSILLYMLLWGAYPPKNTRVPRPVHFTIPILSPFTSVVEHETSVMNTKTMTVISMICACLAYACFRYWFSHSPGRV
ncbi:hypothetical protein NM688_g4244 [Phlebia brevispora]|uniref:Uncharacterized protein n=1 Tax=Phlebia brevispora TaxID=194682 RepID=A0ACC1T3G2_9APHY|nr:hypothetical protein NM688_g4244 [Phlebia brevispora]